MSTPQTPSDSFRRLLPSRSAQATTLVVFAGVLALLLASAGGSKNTPVSAQQPVHDGSDGATISQQTETGPAIDPQFSSSEAHELATSLDEVQQTGPVDCDGRTCIVWLLSSNGGANFLHQVNVCTGAIATAGLVGPLVNTVAPSPAAGGGVSPNLVYGDSAGGAFCTAGFPPSPLVACGAIAAGTNGLEQDSGSLHASGDAPVLGSLFDPALLVGSGGIAYGMPGVNGSDLICDPTGKWGLIGVADIPGTAPGVGALYSISRGNGAQLLPRPVAGRAPLSGLASDGLNRLWGSNVATNILELVNPATGTSVPTWPLLAGFLPLDMASDPCNSCLGGGFDIDLGDAPDSTNHYGVPMTAYAGVPAAFPSVSDPATGLPPGPWHRLSSQDSWLGASVTAELDADQLPDADLITNIDPPTNTPDRDGADDGVRFPITLPPCQMTQFSYVIQVTGVLRPRITNVWFDYNRNGQWGDSIMCVDSGNTYTVSEWAVQDQVTTLGPGTHIITTPMFRSLDPDNEMWMRISLAETTAPPAGDGRGYKGGYEIGETEDYLIAPRGGSMYE